MKLIYLRIHSNQTKVGAKVKKIKEQTTNIKEKFHFPFLFLTGSMVEKEFSVQRTTFFFLSQTTATKLFEAQSEVNENPAGCAWYEWKSTKTSRSF